MSTTPIDKPTALTIPLGNERAAEAAGASRNQQPVPSEHFVALASRILSLRGDADCSKSIGVTSCNTSQGTTTVATQLAIALSAATTGRVLIVELPNMSSSARAGRRSTSVGWAELLTGDANLEDIAKPTAAARFFRVTVGNASHLGALGVDVHRLAAVTRELKAHFEFIIFDLPYVSELTGCLPMSSVLDGVMLVVQQGRVNSQRALQAKLELDQAGARLIGIVMNKSRTYAPRLLYRLLPYLKPR